MDSVVDLGLLKTNEIISLYSDVMVELKPEDGWRYPEPLSGDNLILKSTVCVWNQNY